MHRPRGAVWFFQHLIIALSQRVAAGSILGQSDACTYGSASMLDAARTYGKLLANFFPQASWVIATHFAHNKLRKNASGSIIPKARPIEKHLVAASCISSS